MIRAWWLSPLLALQAAPALPCEIVGGGGVTISGEEALIVWDAANRREHFIRHLSFRGAKTDFGFLVPTPGRPELGEVTDALFSELFRTYAKPVSEQPGRGKHAAAKGEDGSAVEVVEHTRVAGLDATVLAAVDAGAPWKAATRYADDPDLSTLLYADVPPALIHNPTWLTVFEEAGVARGREDLFFERSEDQSPVASTIEHPIF